MTEKIYRDNTYLRELSAKIIEKKYQKGAFHLTLNRTLFYPHLSGGQPKDEGTINGVKVVDVYEKNNEIYHVVENDIFDNNVTLNIDWDVRFDHMQQHTGQHILSTVFSKLYNAKTVGFHLGSEFVYVDIELPKLEEDDIRKIEGFANKIVFSNFEVKSYGIAKCEVSKLPLRKQPTVNENIRIVEINGIEYVPCGGTHVASTGEVGMIKIRKWEKYKGNVRIEFECGYRALEDFRWKNDYLNEISNLLSVKDIDSLEGVKRIYDENKQLIKDIRNLKNNMMQYEIKELINNSIKNNDVKIVVNIFDDKSFKDVQYVSKEITNNLTSIVIFGVIENDKCKLLLSRSDDIDINMKEIFKDVIGIINGQGGGNSKMVQGGGNRIDKLERCIKTSLKLIESQI